MLLQVWFGKNPFCSSFNLLDTFRLCVNCLSSIYLANIKPLYFLSHLKSSLGCASYLAGCQYFLLCQRSCRLRCTCTDCINVQHDGCIILNYPPGLFEGLLEKHTKSQIALPVLSHATHTLFLGNRPRTQQIHMLPSPSVSSFWFLASGYRLDLLLLIVSVGFVVMAKKHSQCRGKIPNICTLNLWDSKCSRVQLSVICNKSFLFPPFFSFFRNSSVRIVWIIKVNCSFNA